jgi:hypothetical protein
MVYALQIFAGQTQPLRSLRTGGDKDCLKTQRAQIVERKVALSSNGHIAIIIEIWEVHHLAELLAQADLHNVFVRINPIFCEPPGFDVAIE